MDNNHENESAKIKKETRKKITEILKDVKEHVVMRDFVTFRTGGVADYYFEAQTIEDLIRAVKAAVSIRLPYFILGNGSNILISDYGFAGLVIKNNSSNIAIVKEKSQVIVDSGVILSRLIMVLASNDLASLEFLYGVPGTIGGAIYSNAGAWGNSIGDFLKTITVLELDEKGLPVVTQHPASWMEFNYRSSKLKKMKSREKPVILTARIQCSQSNKEEIIYRLKNIGQKRVAKQPTGNTAGSIFKNPMPKELENVSGSGTKNMPEFSRERTAGFLLEQAGAKKLKKGTAEVSNIHANFIVNKKDARSSDIRTLIEEMREMVNQKYNIILEEEIEYIGQW